MMTQIKNELGKVFKSKSFLIVIMIEVALVIWYTIKEAMPVITETIPFYEEQMLIGNPLSYFPGAYYIWLGLNFSTQRIVIYAVLPILGAIPYGASLYLEEQSHYTYHMLIRTDKSKYYIAKLLTMFISGGTIGAFPFALSFLISVMLLPLEPIRAATCDRLGSMDMFSELFYESPFLYVLVFLIYTFVCYGLINCLCFVATYIFENRFVVMMLPFIVMYAGKVIGGLLSTGRNVTPWSFFRLLEFWRMDIKPAVIQMLILIAIVVVAYLIQTSKRGDKL